MFRGELLVSGSVVSPVEFLGGHVSFWKVYDNMTRSQTWDCGETPKQAKW